MPRTGRGHRGGVSAETLRAMAWDVSAETSGHASVGTRISSRHPPDGSRTATQRSHSQSWIVRWTGTMLSKRSEYDAVSPSRVRSLWASASVVKAPA